MATAVNLHDATTIATMIPNYLVRSFLNRLESRLVYDKYGVKKDLPEGEGKIIVWHQLLNLGEGYTLGEGSTPTASAVSTRKVSATPVQKANLIDISDWAKSMTVLDVVKESVAALGYNGRLTKDRFISQQIGFGQGTSVGILYAACLATPSVQTQGFPLYDAGRQTLSWTVMPLDNGAFSGTISVSTVRQVVAGLRDRDATPFEDDYFRGVIGPKMSAYLRTDTVFSTWNQFSKAENMWKGKIGAVEGVMFEESSQAIVVNAPLSAWSNSTYTSVAGKDKVYGALIFGQGAYGVSKLGSKDVEMYILSGADKSDPLNQVTLMGYKMTIAAKILNASCGVIIPYYGL